MGSRFTCSQAINVITQCEGIAAKCRYMRQIYQIGHATGHLIQRRDEIFPGIPLSIPLS